MAAPAIDLFDPEVQAEVFAAGERRRREWRNIARPKQLPPDGPWRFWLLMAGRGFGKTRTGAEFIVERFRKDRAREGMLIGATATDVRDVMVEGRSGILAVCERYDMPAVYEPTKMRVTFPDGRFIRTRSAEEPSRIRGPECDVFWWDEFGAWDKAEAFTNADFGARLTGPKGDPAQGVVTFTPKPTPLVKALVDRPGSILVRGHTDENADNLDAETLESFHRQYSGTRLGRQELAGELLLDTPGALWNVANLDGTRRRPNIDPTPDMARIVVGVDPQASDPTTTADEGTPETGIVVAGLGTDGRGYVLEDASGGYSPSEWATVAVAAYERWQADRIVPEKNNGGAMVEHTIRTIDRSVPIKPVWASRGKVSRAEPVAALYEQGRVSHVGTFDRLEDQMTTYVAHTAKRSPDRMDALVWALTDLMVQTPKPNRMYSY